MARFIQYDRNQYYLLPPSVDEWLPEDHFARYIVEVIDQLGLSKLTGRYSRSGSEAYHPALLLALLVYGYATGTFSSRKIEIDFVGLTDRVQFDHRPWSAYKNRIGDLTQLTPVYKKTVAVDFFGQFFGFRRQIGYLDMRLALAGCQRVHQTH